MSMSLDPTIWGPSFWFFLHTITITYPDNPNDVMKRKYYDLIHNLPLFLPVGGSQFAKILDLYPVTPYLDCRESFIRWMIFIHNKYNDLYEKPHMDALDALDAYYSHYSPPFDEESSSISIPRHYIIMILILLLFGIIYYCRF